MVANSLRWTTRDLDAMPDDGGWKRYEIIDGELYVTRAPHIRHQAAGGKIYFGLESWSRQTQLGEPFQTPGAIKLPGIFFAKNRPTHLHLLGFLALQPLNRQREWFLMFAYPQRRSLRRHGRSATRQVGKPLPIPV